MAGYARIYVTYKIYNIPLIDPDGGVSISNWRVKPFDISIPRGDGTFLTLPSANTHFESIGDYNNDGKPDTWFLSSISVLRPGEALPGDSALVNSRIVGNFDPQYINYTYQIGLFTDVYFLAVLNGRDFDSSPPDAPPPTGFGARPEYSGSRGNQYYPSSNLQTDEYNLPPNPTEVDKTDLISRVTDAVSRLAGTMFVNNGTLLPEVFQNIEKFKTWFLPWHADLNNQVEKGIESVDNGNRLLEGAVLASTALGPAALARAVLSSADEFDAALKTFASGNKAYLGTSAVEYLYSYDSMGGMSLSMYFGAALVDGNSARNLYIGGVTANHASAGAGNDIMLGRGGADILNGGDDNDLIYGGSGADRLNGDAGRDILRGDSQNDVLDGGGGADNLTGGLGLDQFVFSATPVAGEVDVIADFAPADDRIVLDANAFPLIIPVEGHLPAGAFAVAGSLTAASRIVYNPLKGTLAYDADGRGGLGATVFARLLNKADISADIFDIV